MTYLNATEAARAGQQFEPQPCEPCTWQPGSAMKIHEMARRMRHGQDLHSSGDSGVIEELDSEGRVPSATAATLIEMLDDATAQIRAGGRDRIDRAKTILNLIRRDLIYMRDRSE